MAAVYSIGLYWRYCLYQLYLSLLLQVRICGQKVVVYKSLNPMTQEEYNQLDTDFAHCAGTHCEKTDKCLHHTAHKMLAGNRNETYTVVNPAAIKGAQPCPFFEPDSKERFAWGISRIYDNVRVADLRCARHEVMAYFGSEVYYKVKQQRRAITEEEQEMVRLSFTEMGYDGSAIEFDRYEEQYSALMRLARYK